MVGSFRLGARILVVDDNPAMLKLIRSLLEDEGMSVVIVESVQEARLALGSSAEQPFDLVLSDISMPGEGGFELLQWIKREGSAFRELPVLLMTAQLPEAEYRVKGLAMGAVDYVERPQDTSELVLRTVNAVEHYRRLRSLETSLQGSEKLATVGRLLAASNHEVKNLVNLVRVASEQILKQFAGASGEKGIALAALDQSSSLLMQVTKSLQFLLAPESSVNRTLDLAATVREVFSLLAKRVAPLALELEGGEDSVWASGHEVGIKQILINLVLNAADAVAELNPPEGGRVRVVLCSDAGQGACAIQVIDNGIGLGACGERAHFEAFETTKRLRGGTGLGLWLSATLARNMSGRLVLRSPGPGLGATAELTLQGAVAPPPEDAIDISKYLIDLDDL